MNPPTRFDDVPNGPVGGCVDDEVKGRYAAGGAEHRGSHVANMGGYIEVVADAAQPLGENSRLRFADVGLVVRLAHEDSGGHITRVGDYYLRSASAHACLRDRRTERSSTKNEHPASRDPAGGTAVVTPDCRFRTHLVHGGPVDAGLVHPFPSLREHGFASCLGL